jgi:hypothetical protein
VFGTLGHTLVVQVFVAAIREGREPLVNVVEGRRSLALVLAIYEAAGLGGENRGLEDFALARWSSLDKAP